MAESVNNEEIIDVKIEMDDVDMKENKQVAEKMDNVEENFAEGEEFIENEDVNTIKDTTDAEDSEWEDIDATDSDSNDEGENEEFCMAYEQSTESANSNSSDSNDYKDCIELVHDNSNENSEDSKKMVELAKSNEHEELKNSNTLTNINEMETQSNECVVASDHTKLVDAKLIENAIVGDDINLEQSQSELAIERKKSPVLIKTEELMIVQDVQTEAFRVSNSTDFAQARDCDSSESSDIVPIAVGIALAALILIVLVSYLCARRRSTSRGYMSF